MQGFYITGTKGSYVELKDGRWADSVGGKARWTENISGECDVEALLDELTSQGDYPEFCDLTMDELKAYVGAD